MHVHKITNNKKYLNEFASTSTTILILSFARDAKDKLSKCKDDSLCKLIYKYKKVF